MKTNNEETLHQLTENANESDNDQDQKDQHNDVDEDDHLKNTDNDSVSKDVTIAPL